MSAEMAPSTRTLRRAVLPWLAPAGGAVFMVACTDPLLARRGLPGIVRWQLSAVIVATLMLPPGLLIAARRSHDFGYVRLTFRPGAMATSCTASLTVAQLLLKAVGAPPPLGNIVWGIGTVIAWTGIYQYAVEGQLAVTERLLTVKDAAQAEELARRCRTWLQDDELDDARRTVSELNLAGALIALSARSDQDDQLDEAFELIVGTAATAPAPLMFAGGERMVDGMRVKALRTGDDVGWDQALDLLSGAVDRVAYERPEAVGIALAARAARLEWRAGLARTEEERVSLTGQAIAELEAAVAATPERLDHHALHVAELARVLADTPGHGDLDDGIQRLRKATRRLRRADPRARDTARLALADLLMRRASLAPVGPLGTRLLATMPAGPLRTVTERLLLDRSSNDGIQAFVLYLAVALTGERSDEARRRLPWVRNQVAESLWLFSLPKWSERQTGWMYKWVANEQAGLSSSEAAATAIQWAAWAEARGDLPQAAAAWWRWVTANATDLRRRVLQDKEPRVQKLQELFAEAADRLVRAGRAADAAVAIDLGRAVLLTERTGRARVGLEDRLTAAGKPQLAERWRAARTRIEQADRAAYHADVTAATGAGTGTGLASAEYLAQTEHETLLREIGALPGFADVDAAPTFADLQDAAREGPLVYLVALDGRGFALVVTDALEPVVVELPDLHRGWIEVAAERMRALTGGRAAARELAALLPALWTMALEPIAPYLPAGSLVTLIPVGALADLPLHMAGTAPDADGVWRDRTDGVVFRYAPNARVLLQSQRGAAALADEKLRVLSVAGAGPDLKHATAESEAIMALLPAGRGIAPMPAAADRVLAALDDTEIWHFCCHGTHDAAQPLESTLELTDRPLTLRELFGRGRGDRRLAILSACQTARLDQTRRDEVVGFPSAMLQAGVAGVVSCQADVDDEAAKLLVLAFLRRFLDGQAPARALAGAQTWLRTATNAELAAAFPEVHLPPDPTRIDIDRWHGHRPFCEPWTWVLFTYTGA